MPDDLIINKDEEPTDADLNEAIVEFTSTSEYIASACAAIAAVGEYDLAMLSNEDQKRIKRIKRKALKILDSCIGEQYDEQFDNDEED